MDKVHIIVGSTREGRAADKITPWVAAAAREKFDVEILDLREWQLPFFQETIATLGDMKNPTYSTPIVKQWNDKIKAGDGFIFITPEYNHSVSGVLKNAIDNVFFSWALRYKPAMMVSYSGGPVGGARALEHLAHIVIEADMVPLRNTVVVANVVGAFGPDGKPVEPRADIALSIALEDLAWFTPLLKAGRQSGFPQPGSLRMRAALAKR
jgi:NAD(P)H-dependent FMN reductase